MREAKNFGTDLLSGSKETRYQRIRRKALLFSVVVNNGLMVYYFSVLTIVDLLKGSTRQMSPLPSS